MKDLLALADPAEQLKAKGFAERSGIVVCGGRPGIPFHVELTAAEVPLSDTNRRWQMGHAQ
jgi:hypothetical protein